MFHVGITLLKVGIWIADRIIESKRAQREREEAARRPVQAPSDNVISSQAFATRQWDVESNAVKHERDSGQKYQQTAAERHNEVVYIILICAMAITGTIIWLNNR